MTIKSTPWLTGMGEKLTINLGAIFRNGLTTLLVLMFGIGGFAGTYIAIGWKPVEVDEVSLKRETVNAIVSGFISAHEGGPGHPWAEEHIRALEVSTAVTAQTIARQDERFTKLEALTLENAKLLNQVLGRLANGAEMRTGSSPGAG